MYHAAPAAPNGIKDLEQEQTFNHCNTKPQDALTIGDTTDEPLSEARRATIKSIVLRLLDQCETPYEIPPYDLELQDLCLQLAKEKGYPVGPGEGQVDVERYLRWGVNVAAGYSHLSRDLQAVIAMYTTFMMYVDDNCLEGFQGVESFCGRFIAGERQESDPLDAMARVLRDTADAYRSSPTQQSLIVMATLQFFAGNMIDREGKTAKKSFRLQSFAAYLRSLTGAQEAYMAFIFPPGTAISTYMEAIPDMGYYINYYNDVISFYKEEKRGETTNFISMEAKLLGEDKLVVLSRLADEVGASSRRVGETLETPEAVRAFEVFKRGYLTFHTCSKRYELSDLFG